MGVYILSEQIAAQRLKIGKPNKKGNDHTGGYLLEIDRRYMEKGENYKNVWPDSLILHSPDREKLTKYQLQYILSMWDSLNHVLTKGKRSEWIKLVDESSFIDFQLMEEFTFDTDGYNNSTFLYKFNDITDRRWKMMAWDFDATYGNNNVGGWRTDIWHYQKVIPSWWSHMMEDPEYCTRVKLRWKQYREGAYSKSSVEHVIDSMAHVLTTGGAEERNSRAWRIWHCSDEIWKGPTYIWPNKYVSSSYEDEIGYLKGWIDKRIDWMDSQLGYTEKEDRCQ